MKRSARLEDRETVRFVTVLAAMLLWVGCSQAAPPVEEQQKREGPERIVDAPPRGPSPDLPAYDITSERDCAETGVVGKCYRVSTDAASREELGLITADLWLDSPGYLAVLVTFYPNKPTTEPTADASAIGFAFENEQAARVVLAQFLAQGTSVEDEVGEAMANGGVYVVAPADEASELTQGTAVGHAGRHRWEPGLDVATGCTSVNADYDNGITLQHQACAGLSKLPRIICHALG
jgi:hypothetical protein